MTRPIRVLVVDDSAFARKVVREILSGSPGIEVVGTARDGLDALEKLNELKPDVVTLDLVMPNLDGVGFLRGLPPNPPRVVVVSLADEQSEIGLEALAAGAVDIVHKPTALAVARLYELGEELVQKVRAAATATPVVRESFPAPATPRKVVTAPRGAKLVVVGASTGGPQALSQIVRALPADFAVPIAVALHMPPGYTEALARRLDHESAADVREAHDGIELVAGRVVIARAGMHLKVQTGVEGTLIGRLDFLPMNKPHRPSVDVLFETAASATNGELLGVVLTGMGDDGMRGARLIRDAGGRILVEAESSCIVYGMPRAVKSAGLADVEAPLEEIVDAMGRV